MGCSQQVAPSVGYYSSAEVQLAYSTAPADRVDYSPDLASSNYWLFARPQKNAPGKRFGSNEKVISETEGITQGEG